MAALLVLEPIFEADLRDSSFGFRPGRSAHDALDAIRSHLDFAVFAKSPRAAARLMASVSHYLTNTLRLVVNRENSRIVPTDEFEYLGFIFVKSRSTINVTPKAIRKFKRRIVEITGRSRGISMERRLGELRRDVRGCAIDVAPKLPSVTNIGKFVQSAAHTRQTRNTKRSLSGKNNQIQWKVTTGECKW